jgi:hypothetical protein
MNTKIVMTLSSIVLGVTGMTFIFASDIVLSHLGIDTNAASLILGQVIGALYFGYSMLNWMAKGSLIGGIYNRPVAIANVTHFFIAGLAIVKLLLSDQKFPKLFWPMGLLYVAFGFVFIIILFRHPVRSADEREKA